MDDDGNYAIDDHHGPTDVLLSSMSLVVFDSPADFVQSQILIIRVFALRFLCPPKILD